MVGYYPTTKTFSEPSYQIKTRDEYLIFHSVLSNAAFYPRFFIMQQSAPVFFNLMLKTSLLTNFDQIYD